MRFIGVEVEQETSTPPPKKILDPPLRDQPVDLNQCILLRQFYCMHLIWLLGLSVSCSGAEVDANCTSANKGALRMADNHLQFCDGKDWVQILDKKFNQNSQETPGW